MHGSFCSIFLTYIFTHSSTSSMLILSCCRHLYTSHPPVACVVNVVHPSFPMMTITSSMMMLMSCLVYPVSAEVQFWPVALYHTRGMAMSGRLRRWWYSKVSLCERRAFSEPPRSCVFLLFLLRYEPYCATGVDPGHRLPSW